MIKRNKDKGHDIDGDRLLTGLAQKLIAAEEKDVDRMMGNPIHGAIKTNCVTLFDQLIAKGVNAYSKNAQEENSLHVAVRSKQLGFLRRLLESGAPTDEQNKNGATALFLACGANYTEAAQILLEFGANPDIATQNGSLALYSATNNDNLELVKALLERGADTNSKSAVTGNKSALHAAAGKANKEIIKLLVTHGADINAIDNSGSRPIDLVDLLEHRPEQAQKARDCFRLLISLGAEFKLQNEDNPSVRDRVAKELYSAILSEDITKGFDDVKATPSASKRSSLGL